MSRIWMLPALVLLLAAPALGHELKVLVSQPSVPEQPARTTVYLSWGHRLPVDDLVAAESIARYELITPANKTLALPVEGESLQARSVDLEQAGVYRAIATLKPAVYTFVIDEDGIRQLRRGPKTNIGGETIDKSFHSRQTGVALIVVGKPSAEPVTALGLAAEILPLDPPAKWAKDSLLRFRVLVEGEPAAGVTLEGQTLGADPDAKATISVETDTQGVASVRLNQTGMWVLKARAELPSAEKVRTQYDLESYTTTLSLGILP